MSLSEDAWTAYNQTKALLQRPVPTSIIQKGDERIWRANDRLLMAAINYIEVLREEYLQKPSEEYTALSAEVWYAIEPFAVVMEQYYTIDALLKNLSN